MIETSFTAVITSVLLSCAVTLLFYFRDKKFSETVKWLRFYLAFSRFCILFLLIFLLFKPHSNVSKDLLKKPVLPVLVDNSSSVSQIDSLNKKKIRQFITRLKADLNQDVAIRIVPFSDRLNLEDTCSFDRQGTNLSRILEESSDYFVNQNVPAGILISDGIITSGKRALNNPGNFPIYSVAVGDTSKQVDAKVVDLFVNDIVYAKNDFPVELNLHFNQLKGSSQNVKVYLGGVLKKTFTVQPSSNNFFKEQEVYLSTEKVGIVELRVVVENKISEFVKTNNEIIKYIEVLNNRQKILFVEGNVHPDFRAVKSALWGKDNFEIKTISADQKIPLLNHFNVVVLLGNAPQMNLYPDVLLEHKVNFLWFTGASGEFNNKVLRLNRLDNDNDNASPLFNEPFRLINYSDSVQQFFSDLAPLKVPFGKWSFNGSNEVLLFQNINGVKTNYPMFTFGSFQETKYAAFIGEGIWNWQFFQNETFGELDDLIVKAVNYLSVKQDPSALKIALKKKYISNEEVVIKASFYNESMQLDNSGMLELSITNSSDETYQYEFLKSGGKYELNIGRLSPGIYTYRVDLSRGDQKLKEEGRFIVEAADLEIKTLEANHSVLQDLSKSTNGAFYTLEKSTDLITALNSSKMFKPISYLESKLEPLIKNKWIFYVLFILLITEWFIRKWQGTI